MLATAASSFFIPFLFTVPLSAQRVEVYAAAAAVVSSDLVTDDIATPTLRQLLGGGIDREVTARAAPGPALAVGVRVAARPRVAILVEAGWAPATLEVNEDGRTRSAQDLHVLDAGLGASWMVRSGVELGGSAGVLAYLSDDHGLFAEGSNVAPAVRAHLGVQLPVWSRRLGLFGAAQLHRFGTPAIRRLGGSDGTVARIQVGARVRLAEVGR